MTDVVILNSLGHFAVNTQPFYKDIRFFLIFQVKKIVRDQFFQIMVFIGKIPGVLITDQLSFLCKLEPKDLP